MTLLFAIIAIIFVLCGIFLKTEKTLIKIVLANSIYTMSIFFICIYSLNSAYKETFSLIDIALIYSLTSFIFNISLIKYYKSNHES
jgi:multisubunit Na+/H+ antiporter MnhF subunit